MVDFGLAFIDNEILCFICNFGITIKQLQVFSSGYNHFIAIYSGHLSHIFILGVFRHIDWGFFPGKRHA